MKKRRRAGCPVGCVDISAEAAHRAAAHNQSAGAAGALSPGLPGRAPVPSALRAAAATTLPPPPPPHLTPIPTLLCAQPAADHAILRVWGD